jgi:hypothetical protein
LHEFKTLNHIPLVANEGQSHVRQLKQTAKNISGFIEDCVIQRANPLPLVLTNGEHNPYSFRNACTKFCLKAIRIAIKLKMDLLKK